MALQTQPTGMQDVTADWWPSRCGAEDEAGALNEIKARAAWLAANMAQPAQG